MRTAPRAEAQAITLVVERLQPPISRRRATSSTAPCARGTVSSDDQPIRDFVPILVERQVRDLLGGLVGVDLRGRARPCRCLEGRGALTGWAEVRYDAWPGQPPTSFAPTVAALPGWPLSPPFLLKLTIAVTDDACQLGKVYRSAIPGLVAEYPRLQCHRHSGDAEERRNERLGLLEGPDDAGTTVIALAACCRAQRKHDESDQDAEEANGIPQASIASRVEH